MGKMSALVKSGLTRSLHKRLPFCKVRIVFGKIFRHMKVRVSEHQRVSSRTGKHLTVNLRQRLCA